MYAGRVPVKSTFLPGYTPRRPRGICVHMTATIGGIEKEWVLLKIPLRRARKGEGKLVNG